MYFKWKSYVRHYANVYNTVTFKCTRNVDFDGN